MHVVSLPKPSTSAGRSTILILSVVLLFCTAFPSGASQKPGEDLFTPDVLGGSWKLDGKPGRYTSENLYEPINGEAELYFPYGFEVLDAATYVKSGSQGVAITCEVFRMGSLLDAFGIYSNYLDPEADVISLGGGAFAGESQLMFFKDRYFVRLSVSGSTEGERSVFLAFAEMIASRIDGGRSRPRELEYLKVPGVIAGTEKYIAVSVLGYPFLNRGMVAEARINGNRAKIFVLLHDSVEAAQKSLNAYLKYLGDRGVKPEMDARPGEYQLFARDPLYGSLVMRRVGTFLLGAAKVVSPEKGRVLLDSLETRLLLKDRQGEAQTKVTPTIR